jgi:hypothetical protein
VSKGSPGRSTQQTQCRFGQKRHDQKLRENTCGEPVELLERIGRLREKNSRVSPDYRIEVKADDEKNNAIRIEWQRELQSQQKDQHCGVYCLRTNIKIL